MKCEEARPCFVDLWRGSLEEEERAALSGHLAECESCRRESAELGRLWTRLEALPEAEPSPRVRQQFYARLSDYGLREQRRHNFAWLYNPAFGAVAAALILTAGVGLGRLTSRPLPSSNEATVSRLQVEVADMKQMVALSLMQQQSASERIKGVSYAMQTADSDQQVVTALISTVNHDPNVNVRLAAIDALRRFSAPSVRTALPQSLGRQDSPLAQIAVLDNIVELRERNAAPAIQSLLSRQDVNPAVRQHAQWALRQLE